MRTRFGFLALALAMCMSLCVTASALGDDDTPPVFTPAELTEINRHNQMIDDYMASSQMTRVLDRRTLNIAPVTQANGSYCGPACAYMAANYLGLRDRNGNPFTQSTIAPIIGYTGSATYSGDIARGMNNLLGRTVYELTNVRNSDLVSSLAYGINHDFPMFINVLNLPNYSTPTSGHFILGVGYSIYTQGSVTYSNVVYNDPRIGYGNQYTITGEQMVDACLSNAGNFVRAVP